MNMALFKRVRYYWFRFIKRISFYDWLWKIRDYFYPQQRWLIKKLPKHWIDKDKLFELVLFEGLVHFVEHEKALEVIDWNSTDNGSEIAQMIHEIYNWIKIERPVKSKELDIAFDAYCRANNPNEAQHQSKICADLEEEIDRRDTKYLVWLVANRHLLWV